MADYVDLVLAEASSTASSKGPFVAIGVQMWRIWQIVIWFKQGLHRQPSTTALFQAILPSLGYDENPFQYSRNLGSYPPCSNARLDTGQEVSAAKWLPSKDDPFTNPWFDVVNFVFTTNKSDKDAGGFRFTSLPLELIVHVAAFLPNESIVALALTCKAMYSLIGQRVFNNLSPSEQWGLLLFLERDSELLVACQECLKLHNPLAPVRHQLPCRRLRRSCLPGSITPAFCRLLAKYYIRQKPYGDLLNTRNRTEFHILPDFKIFKTLTCHINTGNLFLRQETFIAPLTNQGELTGRGAYLLHEILDWENGDICPHVRWQHLGLELSRGPNSGIRHPSSLSASYLKSQFHRVNIPWDGLFGDGIGRELHEMDGQRVFDFYKDDRWATAHRGGPCRSSRELNQGLHLAPDCYDSTTVPRAVLDDALGPGLKCALLHPQPCTDADCDRQPSRFRVNLVRACEICATDMCVSAQDVEGIGRVIALTRWKKIGGVYDGEWASWYAHSQNVEDFAFRFLVDPEDATVRRDLSCGTAVYTACENLPTSSAEPRISWYKAPISRRMRAVFSAPPPVLGSWWELPWAARNPLSKNHVGFFY
ncbi:hypothetical protein VTI74DRAFT_1964 [Chaetomium olivicolor]